MEEKKKGEDAISDASCSVLVPLGTWLSEADDYYILESLAVIRLKKRWNVNAATIALRDACLKEWYIRYGPDALIPEVEISEESKALLESEI